MEGLGAWSVDAIRPEIVRVCGAANFATAMLALLPAKLRRYCRHRALALVQALLHPLGLGTGAGIIAPTWPWHWCRQYCTHLALALVQALLHPLGPGTGAGVFAPTWP